MDKHAQDEILADFYTNAKDGTLPVFYTRYSNKDFNLTNEIYQKLVDITYSYFCQDEEQDRLTASQQSIVAHELGNINRRMRHKGNSSIKAMEFGCRTAALMEPNDLTIVEDWKNSIQRVSAKLGRNETIDVTRNDITQLGIEKTIFGRHVSKKYGID